MEGLIVSMMRFSAAVTLYGIEQMQNTMNIFSGGENLSSVMDKLEKTLDSLSDTLANKVDSKKRDTLKSVTRMSEDVVERSMDGLNIMDPREVLRATNDLMQKTTDATAEWVSKTSSSVAEEVDRAARSGEVHIDQMTVDEVLDAVDRGEIAAADAIRAEEKGKKRSTLIAALENKWVDVDNMTVEEVLEAVNSGRISNAEAIEAEKKGKNRTTLIASLEEKSVH